MEPDYTFVEEYHKALDAAVDGLQEAGFKTTGYETRGLKKRPDFLDDAEHVKQEFEHTIFGLKYDDPKQMVADCYRRIVDSDDPVIGELIFRTGSGGEFIPYNGRSSGETPTVEYRIGDDNDPYFSVSAGELQITYESTIEYLATLGEALHDATDHPVSLPDTVEDDLGIDLYRAPRQDTMHPDNRMSDNTAPAAADDD